MAPHSSTLAWKIPWTEEPGRVQSMGLRRVMFDSAMLANGKARIRDIMMRAFQPTAEFSQGQQCIWCKTKEKCPLAVN